MASRLVLVIGDLFVPDRALDIPAKFKKLLTPGKIGQILCLGNLTDASTFDFLRSLAPDLHLVRGPFDLPSTTTSSSSTSDHPPSSSSPSPASLLPTTTPLSKVVTHGSLRIGLTHGHTIIPQADPDALLIAARQMDVDVLLWAGTHRFEAYELEGKFFVNPGSATGAFSTSWGAGPGGGGGGGGEDVVPSFCLMDVQGDVLVLYVYQLRTDENGVENVGVEKVSFRKQAPTAAA